MRFILWYKKKLDNITLAWQLIFWMGLAIIIILLSIMGFTHKRTIKMITDQQISSSTALLELKQYNFETYFSQLKDYSLSLRNDNTFVEMISSKAPITYANEMYIKSLLRNIFYSRKDITDFKLYILNASRSYTISRKSGNIYTNSNPHYDDEEAFKEANHSPYYIYIKPSTHAPNELMTIYRAIINIRTGDPIAYVQFTVDNSFLTQLAYIHTEIPSTLILLDANNQIYFSSNASFTHSNAKTTLIASLQETSARTGHFINKIGDDDYLAVYQMSSDADWAFVNFLPKAIIDKEVNETRNLSLLIGMLVFIGAINLILWPINLLTKPLKLLADQMIKVGGGNLKTQVHIGGSLEINHLCTQFNSMIRHVDTLIEKNYIATINEKNAKLIALEAQLNPHFLYNTLQAISSAAILSGQKNISHMVEALSSIMRYTIKDGDLVPLSAEIKHVNAYLLLQKSRFDERLQYHLSVDSTLENFLLPKLSVQLLVENAINHGMRLECSNITITINIFQQNNYLVVQVKDNGCGMTQEHLNAVRSQMDEEDFNAVSIGLNNLSSRLRILYEGNATLTIDSILHEGTVVFIFIPLDGEVKQNYV